MPAEALFAGGTRVTVLRGQPGALAQLDPAPVVEALLGDGAVLLRDCAPTLAEFRQFSARIGAGFVPYPCPTRAEVDDGDDTIQLVAPTDRAIPLHAELCYLPCAPDLCWFYCARADDGEGGHTLLADGVALARALADDERIELERPIRYQLEIPIASLPLLFAVESLDDALALIEARGWSHAFARRGEQLFVDWRRSLLNRTHAGAPAFVNQLIYWGVDSGRITWADGEAIDPAALAAAREASERCTLDLAWQSGDVLVFDNHRCLHGRRRILDPERRVYTRFAIGFDGHA